MTVERDVLEYLERNPVPQSPHFIRNIFTIMITLKKGFIAAAAIAALGTGAMGISPALASEGQNPHALGMEGLVQALADAFNVSTDEVKAVLEAHHEEMQTNREEHQAERLAQAVTDGKLTQEQADAINEHREEMEALLESLEGATPEERKEALHAQREENRIWARENNIPPEFLVHEGPRNENQKPNHGPRHE